ncbi:hypothetical protein COJ93_11670 [Bacillus anthracis]|nr:hypothetical protein CON33_29130 [Bacillus anthracis]PFP36908.1 hypothetical protein COJ93_11670 [Bacillus anthracis]
MNENIEILKLRKSIKERFHTSIETIIEMFKELESENYQTYLSSSPLLINSPLEDAIRYRYIILVELFKRFSRAINYTYFRFSNNIKNEDKYCKMNIFLLKDDDTVKVINDILEDRNNLAHIWIEDVLDFNDNDFLEKAQNAVMLFEVLEKYIEFIDNNDPFKTNIKKITLS